MRNMGELSGPEQDFDIVRHMFYHYMRERKPQVRHIWFQNEGKFIELAFFILSYNNWKCAETVVFFLSYYKSECDETAVFFLSCSKGERVESAVFVLPHHKKLMCRNCVLGGRRML